LLGLATTVEPTVTAPTPLTTVSTIVGHVKK
jgi:hypothetical protein